MRFGLFDFQKRAADSLIEKMVSMRRSYDADGSLSAVSLTAPTGAGKTVISAAVAETLFFGGETFDGDDSAVILWLSDSPSLNGQTMKKFCHAADLLGAASMEAIGPEFAKSYRKLMPGHVYFLNRQLLGRGKRLSGETEGGRSFYDVLTDTIEDESIHLYLFIDEAHRGIGKGQDSGTPESVNKTIYSTIIDGQEGANPPMPCVVGISATPERFDAAMKGRRNRDIKAGVVVPPEDVRSSGLIKDIIELRTPANADNEKSDLESDLLIACERMVELDGMWNTYCAENSICPPVTPLMVVQVEDKVSKDMLSRLCGKIKQYIPSLDTSTCFANVFGEHEDIVADSGTTIPYINPDEVSERTDVRVLFAKDAISTGWDCPRAEVIYSRRRRSDSTYIAQLIGRMVRTPLARRVDYGGDALNAVACYLPRYDSKTVDDVVERLQRDVPVNGDDIIRTPVDTYPIWQNGGKTMDVQRLGIVDKEFEPLPMSAKDITAGVPTVNPEALHRSFEGIVSHIACRGDDHYIRNMCRCMDIVTFDIEPFSDIVKNIPKAFCDNIEGEIHRRPAEYERAFAEMKNGTIAVKRVDTLTGSVVDNNVETVKTERIPADQWYKETVRKFEDASDIINAYLIYRTRNGESPEDAVARITAAGRCPVIFEAIKSWARDMTGRMVEEYGPKRELVSDANRAEWDAIEGNTAPYVKRNLSIRSAPIKQNGDNDRYPMHIIASKEGWAYFRLNELEKAVLRTELSKSSTAAWYRNQSRNQTSSLSIPYYINGRWENMYPDFIFFEESRRGVTRYIVDPHGDWLGDSVPKLKGYIKYIKEHTDMFSSVLVVAAGKDGEFRYLDLKIPAVRAAIENFTGTSAKELFDGQYGRKYHVKE